MPEPIKINKAGAFRVRSGEAKAVKVVPRPGPAPKASTPMPVRAARIREIWRSLNAR